MSSSKADRKPKRTLERAWIHRKLPKAVREILISGKRTWPCWRLKGTEQLCASIGSLKYRVYLWTIRNQIVSLRLSLPRQGNNIQNPVLHNFCYCLCCSLRSETNVRSTNKLVNFRWGMQKSLMLIERTDKIHLDMKKIDLISLIPLCTRLPWVTDSECIYLPRDGCRFVHRAMLTFHWSLWLRHDVKVS